MIAMAVGAHKARLMAEKGLHISTEVKETESPEAKEAECST